MKTTHRDYVESFGDSRRLARFMVTNNEAIRTYSTWCLGRLADWRYNVYAHKWPIERFCEANAHLWFDGFGELAGFAISENGDAGLAFIMAPGYRFLFEEMLHWALGAWAERGPRFSVEITAWQEMEARILEQAGFRRRLTYRRQTFDLTKELPARYLLPEGFTIVDMASRPDYRAQWIMRAEAFRGDADFSPEELEADLYRQALYHDSPTYHAATDLCVVAEDGTFVAGCEALIDPWSLDTDVERVCTHSAYRRRGLARAVIQECLYRLQEMGIRQASITGYGPGAMALYASLGAAQETTCYIYETAEG